MCPDGRISVVLLVGIPASGKSYFRKYFEAYLCGKVDLVLGSVHMWSVCYDDNEHQMRLQNSKWKQCRLDIIRAVGNLIENITSKKPLRETFNETSGICLINKEIESPDSTIILIDDNMYYRSMRYEYYKLAKTHNIGFSQIYFVVDLQKALDSNSKRSADSRVPEIVIENMYKKLEPPEINHVWEKYSVSVLSYADFQDQNVSSKILSCIRNGLDNPIQVKDVNSNGKEMLFVTNSNAIHQIDNILKKLVSDHIKNQIGTDNNSDLNLISKVYSERRLKLLKLIKSRVITLPIDLSENITKETINILKPILSDLLSND